MRCILTRFLDLNPNGTSLKAAKEILSIREVENIFGRRVSRRN